MHPSRKFGAAVSGWLSVAALLVLAGPARAITAQQLEATVRNDPRNLRAWWELGVAYYKDGKFLGAAKAWDKVARLKPKLAKVKFYMGKALYKATKYELAAKYWRNTLCLEPDHEKARDGLTLLQRRGTIDADDIGPDRSCREAAAPDPQPARKEPADEAPAPGTPATPPKKDPESLDQLAGIEPAKDKSKAEEAWELAKRLSRSGQTDKAIEAYRDAYRFGYEPKSEVDFFLGKALLESERIEPAIFHLDRVRAAADGTVEPQKLHLSIGKAWSLKGDNEKEITSYQDALKIDPEFGEAHFMLALAYDKVRNSPKVLEHAQKAIRINPDYKEKLKPRIKDSNVSKQIGGIVTRVLEDSKFERLTDEKIEEYAEEIGRILGEENLNADEFMGGGNATDKVKTVLQGVKDGRGKQALDEVVPKDKQGEFLKIIRKNEGRLQGLKEEFQKGLK